MHSIPTACSVSTYVRLFFFDDMIMQNVLLRCFTFCDLHWQLWAIINNITEFLVVAWHGGNVVGAYQRSYSTSGPVSTGMGDRLRQINHLSISPRNSGQLSLLPSAGLDEVLACVFVWSEVQMICIWSGSCHCQPIIFCFVKIQNGLTFLMPACLGCPGKEAVKQVSCW